jgi:hypothetical protein
MRRGGRDAARRPREQSNHDLFLESANRVAECGLRDTEALCRFREAPLAGHCQEGGHDAEFISDHS